MSSDFLKGVIVGSALFACLMMVSAPFISARAIAMCLEAQP